MVSLKEFFQKVNYEKNSKRQNSMKNYPACNVLIHEHQCEILFFFVFSDKGIEPAFVVEPVVEKQDDRRMSIKCSVSGQLHLSQVMRNPAFLVSDHVWYKPGCTVTEDGYRGLNYQNKEVEGLCNQ